MKDLLNIDEIKIITPDWNILKMYIKHAPEFQITTALNLKNKKVPVLTWDDKGNVSLFTGRGKDVDLSFNIMSPLLKLEKG